MADKRPFVLIEGDVGGITDGDTIGVVHGGTGATSPVNARTSLGLGDMAVQNSFAVNITGGTISGVVVSATPAGTTSSIQYNNAGAFGASSNFTYDTVTNTLSLIGNTPNLLLKSVATEPALPTSDSIKLYSISIASRVLPKWVDSSGQSTTLQQSLMFNSIIIVRPSSANGQTISGTNVTNVGTLSTPTLVAGSLLNSFKRTLFTAATTTVGTLVSQRTNTTILWRGNAPRLGGFMYHERFAFSTLVATQRAFVGVSDTTAAPSNIDPLTSTTPGKIGLAVNTNTGNWNLVFNVSGTAPTVVPLGASFPVNITDIIEIILSSEPNGASIGYRIKNLNSSIEVSDTLTTNIPSNTTFLLPWKFMTNNATAATFAFLSLGLTVEAAS